MSNRQFAVLCSIVVTIAILWLCPTVIGFPIVAAGLVIYAYPAQAFLIAAAAIAVGSLIWFPRTRPTVVLAALIGLMVGAGQQTYHQWAPAHIEQPRADPLADIPPTPKPLSSERSVFDYSAPEAAPKPNDDMFSPSRLGLGAPVEPKAQDDMWDPAKFGLTPVPGKPGVYAVTPAGAKPRAPAPPPSEALENMMLGDLQAALGAGCLRDWWDGICIRPLRPDER